MKQILLIIILAGGLWAGSGTAKNPHPLPPALISVWEKSGFNAGWMEPHRESGSIVFSEKPEQLEVTKAVPAFKVPNWKSGILESLPAPKTEFGLDLIDTEITDVDLKEVSKLQQLTTLDLSNCYQITDAGLKEVAKLKRLSSLNLSIFQFTSPRITDKSLKEVSKLLRLTTLNLSNRRQITDNGLKELVKLQQLSSLNLADTKITDAGLKEVSKLQKLYSLNLSGCKQITNKGLKEVA